ncbi:MAG: protein translocase subunit SecF [Candidatus Peribacteraceae bacterium]|nr:protein translocase subunit SecF [Candidatus Peribacteraceae bacterium]
MSFRQLSKFFLALSVVMVAASIALFVYPGPKYSIEFTGGTLLQIQAPAGKTRDDVIAAVQTYEKTAGEAGTLGNYSVTGVKTASEEAFILRMRAMTNEEHLALIDSFRATLGEVKELKYNTIGPTLSASLKWKSLQALVIASIATILYLAIAFRKLPRKLSPWKFGLIVVAAFMHDVIVTIGAFIVLGWFTSFEFDILFVTALLTILAYSTNEAIVVFDRVRANLTFDNRSDDLSDVVVAALKQCVGRTSGTTVAIVIMLSSLFIMGAESIRWFILALIFGAVMGVYSSYLVAAPLLMHWEGKNTKK